MAGRARHHALTEELERRTKDVFDPDPEDAVQPTSLDYVCHWIESGQTSKALAADVSQSLPFTVDYAGLMRYLNVVHGEENVAKAIETARVKSSFALAEEALAIVDEKAETSAEIARAASRARSRQWMAERYNQQRFGQNKGVNVQINVGELHLDALRARPTSGTATLEGVTTARPGIDTSLAPARLIVPPGGMRPECDVA